MLTLAQLAALTGAKQRTLYRYIKRHNLPYKRDKHGRIVASVASISGYRPRNNPHWLLKAGLA